MKIKTNIKAGLVCRYCAGNHNEAQVQGPPSPTKPLAAGLRIKTDIKAGGAKVNHNEQQLNVQPAPTKSEAATPGLKIKTNIKAGDKVFNHNETFLAAR